MIPTTTTINKEIFEEIIYDKTRNNIYIYSIYDEINKEFKTVVVCGYCAI